MSTHHAVVVDVGSSSGRVLIATLDDTTLSTTEVHRFAHHAEEHHGQLVWDIDRITVETITGLEKAKVELGGGVPATVSIDTWGVDYVCVDVAGNRVGPVVSYRDQRTARTADIAQESLRPQEHFGYTGVQPEAITTARQLCAQTYEQPGSFEGVDKLLLLPDYLAMQLTGVAGWSPTIMSTTALATPGARHWADQVFEAFEIPRRLVGPPAASMSSIGAVTIPRLENFTVVRGGAHDTACAVHGLGLDAGEAFLSCGSWSLVGCVQDHPALDPEVFEAGFSNEVCTDGRIRLLRNLTGLWILQQSCRVFEQQGREHDIAILAAKAAQTPDPGVFIDTTDPVFAVPGDYPVLVTQALREAGYVDTQEEYADPALIVRVITASLARAHAAAVADLERLTRQRIRSLRMIGGGVRNTLLCQLTANECGIPVVAGPQEGTAFGSALAQFEIQGLDRARLLELQQAHTVRTVYTPNT